MKVTNFSQGQNGYMKEEEMWNKEVILRRGLLGSVFIALALTSSEARDARTACEIGKVCGVEGVIIVYPPADGEQTWLNLDNKTCVALSLPDFVYKERDRWDGQKVVVTGTAYAQPKGTYLYYEIKGKRISAGVCDGAPLIIVDKIKLT